MGRRSSLAAWVFSATVAGVLLQNPSDSVDRIKALVKLRKDITNRDVAQLKVAPETIDESNNPVVDIEMDIKTATVLGGNEIDTVVTVGVYMSFNWSDPQLAWDPANYSWISSVEMNRDSVWTPEVRVINAVDHEPFLESVNTLSLHSTGFVRIETLLIVDIMCYMSMPKFPYDSQDCDVIFMFTSHGKQYFRVNVSPTEGVLNYLPGKFRMDNEWTNLDWLVKNYTMSDIVYPALRLKIGRRTLFYTGCLVMPLMVTAMMTSLVFFVKSDERVSYVITIFFSTSIFIGFISEMMPRGIEMLPWVVIMIQFVMFETLGFLVLTLFVPQSLEEKEWWNRFRILITAVGNYPTLFIMIVAIFGI